MIVIIVLFLTHSNYDLSFLAAFLLFLFFSRIQSFYIFLYISNNMNCN